MMDFLQHTTNWIKGEIFEATVFGFFGLLSIICSLLLWKFGETPGSRALIIPIIVVGLFFVGTALSGITSNKKRLPQYSEAYHQDKIAFVKSEKARVEGFQYLYKMTIIIAALAFGAAICVFALTHNTTWRGVAIALTIFAAAGLIVDYFSKERADNYYKKIERELHTAAIAQE